MQQEAYQNIKFPAGHKAAIYGSITRLSQQMHATC